MLGPTHPKRLLSEWVHAELAKRMEHWQAQKPDRLIPASWVVLRMVAELGVTRPAAGTHLTDAVAEGMLVEILVRRDWLVMLPYQLYAVPDGELYWLSTERPASRGSNGISFLTTPTGYSVLLDKVMKEFGPSPEGQERET